MICYLDGSRLRGQKSRVSLVRLFFFFGHFAFEQLLLT